MLTWLLGPFVLICAFWLWLHVRTQRRKLEIAAYHEAGHAVAAAFSKYCFLPYEISANASGHGALHVAVSRTRKAQFAGPNQSMEIGMDLATIAFAGFDAERRYARSEIVFADRHASRDDFQFARTRFFLSQLELRAAVRLAKKRSRDLIDAQWDAIEKVASAIISAPNHTISYEDANQIIGASAPIQRPLSRS